MEHEYKIFFKLKGINMPPFEIILFVAAFAMRVSHNKVCFVEILMPLLGALDRFNTWLFLSESLRARANAVY